MTKFVIDPAPKVCLPIRGSNESFPVRRIYCIGRNYGDHAIEMGHDPNKESPFFFQKNAQNVDTSGKFPFPPQTSDVHHEIELVVALKSGGTDISLDKALEHVYGYGLGLDMTRRDLQGEAKKLGRPWEVGKSFEKSAPMSELVPASETRHLDQGRICLKVNGEIKQDGNLNQMIWKVPEMIAYLSRFYDIAGGDLIMSGTPAGVGPIQRGDKMDCEIENLATLTVEVI
ncbi:MAG: fumarylacetoacetate hydrolase family protein [Deltaproteobacteria bacterium]|mgnify:FL=1|jgi:fumarylpyruvate hydrolase|nr:fumarylacetoacetate hydrolase family protein [Deltaproteobacteria bacterium]